eukprot:3095375-Alexandrium_andersonii.AAC.1
MRRKRLAQRSKLAASPAVKRSMQRPTPQWRQQPRLLAALRGWASSTLAITSLVRSRQACDSGWTCEAISSAKPNDRGYCRVPIPH